MIKASKQFKALVEEGYHAFIYKIEFYLKNGTYLEFDNSNLLGNTFTINDCVSTPGIFEVGTAIMNRITFTILDFEQKFIYFDFEDALIVVKIGIEEDEIVEYVQRGVYNVDSCTYKNNVFSFVCVDNMKHLEVGYDKISTVYPASLKKIVEDICDYCGIEFVTPNFINSDIVISKRPDDKDVTCRAIISYVSQMASSYARMNSDGDLTFSWYYEEISDLSDNLDGGIFDDNNPIHLTGDNADGGAFHKHTTKSTDDGGLFIMLQAKADDVDGGEFDDNDPYHITGDDVCGCNFYWKKCPSWTQLCDVIVEGGTFDAIEVNAIIRKLFTSDINILYTEIGRVRVQTKPTKYDEEPIVITIGDGGFLVHIKDNPLIEDTTLDQVAHSIADRLIGIRFRVLNISAIHNPLIEAGDVAYAINFRNNSYYFYIMNTTFSSSGRSVYSCDAEPININRAKYGG